MNFSFFIAQRFFRSIGSDKRQASNPTITIATAGVAIGLAVMIISVGIILGFKREITKKVEGFGSHIEILDLNAITAPDGFPVASDGAFLAAARQIPGVKSVNRVVQKMGILKTENDFSGVTFKGLPSDYDTTFVAHNIVEGRLPKLSETNGNDILISRRQATDLHLKVGDRVFAYFFEESIKARRFTVVGIYQSNMAIFDKNIIIAPITTIETLNKWDSTRASIIEMRLHNFDQIDKTLPLVKQLCQHSATTPANEARQAISIKELYSQIFAWLDLLDFNMIIILVLMTAVSGFTMVSGLFILILERTQTIGVLKAMGASNTRIRSIFLNFAALITIRGLLIGDALALVVLFAQQQWGFIHLDPATYYVETVPVVIHWGYFFALNVITLALVTLALVAPSYMISRIQPAKAIRFE